VRDVVVKDEYRLAEISRTITPNVIVDVGGHIGSFGVKAKSIWPEARLIAFEPTASSFALYQENLKRFNCEGLVRQVAISYANKSCIADDSDCFGSGILIDENEIDVDGKILTDAKVFSGKKHIITERNVITKTLEDVMLEHDLDNIDLLKLDCEGSEVDILKNMSAKTASKINCIVGEFHCSGGFEEFRALLLSKFPLHQVSLVKSMNEHVGSFVARPRKALKIKLVHILSRPETTVERRSINSLSQLKQFGIEYVQQVNGYETKLPAIEPKHPTGVWGQPLKPGYYGVWKANRRSIEEEFHDDVDFLVTCERDVTLAIPPEECYQKMLRCMYAALDAGVDYLSFGYKNSFMHAYQVVHSKELESINDEMFITDQIIGLQCIAFPRSTRDFLFHVFKTEKWYASDIWFNEVFRAANKKLAIVREACVIHDDEGDSVIDQGHKPIIGAVTDNRNRPGGFIINTRTGAAESGDLHVVGEILTKDGYELDNIKRILPTCPKAIVDVGGHIGSFGLKAKSLWPSAKLVAYEPNVESCELYKQNMNSNAFSYYTVYNEAVSYEQDKTILVEDVTSTDGGVLTNRALFNEATGRLALDRLNPLAKYRVGRSNVPSLTIEQLMSRDNLEYIDILKLDCEGSEIEILRQMLPETAQKIGLIVGEFHYAGGYTEFVSLLKQKFPNFLVIPLTSPGPCIGQFMAAPPEIINNIHTAKSTAIKTSATRALVTGGAGFIGSHLTDHLVRSGYEVAVLDNLSSESSNIQNVNAMAKFYRGDTTSKKEVDNIFDEFRPDIVFHLAAKISVPESFVNPAETTEVNVAGSSRVLEASKRCGVKRFVFMSSGGALYGETAQPANEEAPTRPVSPYGVSKLCFENLLMLGDNGSMDVVILRPSNVYGPRQQSGVISVFMKRLAKGLMLDMYGEESNNSVRDYVFVSDVVSALAMSITLSPGIYNVSTGAQTTIRELVARVSSKLGASPKINMLASRGDVKKSVLDSSKLMSHGWKPEVSLPEGISLMCPAKTKAPDETKILFFAPHCSTGGMPQYMLWCVTNAIRSGHCVEVVEFSDISPSFVVQKNKIKQLCPFHSLGADKLGEISDIIRRFNPDIIHLQEAPEMWMPDSMATYLFRKDKTYKIIETSHTAGFDVKGKKYLPDMFSFASQYHLKQYEHILKLGIPYVVSEYIIDRKPRPDRAESLRALGLDPHKKHVLNVGLFTPGKNQGQIFRIAKMLPDVMFHFVGNQADNFAHYWQPLMQDKPDNCVVWGERNDVDAFYSAMDLFLFTSLIELKPIVIKEAMAWGMPILMYNLPEYEGLYNMFPNVSFLTKQDDEYVCDAVSRAINSFS